MTLVLVARIIIGELLRHGHHLRRQGALVVRRGRGSHGGVLARVRRLRAAEDDSVRPGVRGALGEKVLGVCLCVGVCVLSRLR